MAKIIAFVLLALGILASFISGLFGVMGARSAYQLLAVSIMPTAIVPVAYFLVAHGLLARNDQQAYAGISAAILIFIANLVIMVIWFQIMRVLVANHVVSDQASGPVYILLSVMLAAQLLLFLRFRRRMRTQFEETEKAGLSGSDNGD